MQDTLTYEAERIASNLKFVDGMVWSHANFLAVADVRERKIYRIDSSPNPKLIKDDDGGASGLAYDVQNRLYICESVARRVSRMDLRNKIEPLAETFEGKEFNSPNDIVVRRDGHVYFTDPAFGSADDHRELDFYGVFHITPKGEIEAAAKWRTRPNGIALSPDGKILYVCDSDRHVVVAFDLDGKGTAGKQRDLVRNIKGVPGGIKTDAEGRLYVAALGIHVYSAQGRQERTLMDSTVITNCAFGEPEIDALFVSARGSIFRLRLGVKGALQY